MDLVANNGIGAGADADVCAYYRQTREQCGPRQDPADHLGPGQTHEDTRAEVTLRDSAAATDSTVTALYCCYCSSQLLQL